MTPSVLVGSAKSGESCGKAEDCAPTCCSCSTGSNSWLGSECVSGKCADGTTACADTRNDSSYCM
jgi:hypothetical protein